MSNWISRGLTATLALLTTASVSSLAGAHATSTPIARPISSASTRASGVPNAGPIVAKAVGSGSSLLIEHGFDIDTAASVGRHVAQIEALPFDGISVQPEHNPCSPQPVSLVDAQADLNAMPHLTHVRHNFVLCRIQDNADLATGANPFDIGNDATWATIAANLNVYAQAAQATGMFDGIMIDTEYYGSAVNPWDYDTIPIPHSYGPSRPWTLPADAQALAQRRGRETMDAMRAGWPSVVAFHLRGGELSDPATFKPGNMAGYDVAWANELAGPFFVGAVESAQGTAAGVVDGGESYHQRTASDFDNSYTWLHTRFAQSGGPIVPSGAVSAASYNATISVASQVFDKDITQPDRPTFSSNQLEVMLSYSRQATDKYRWIFSETFDWRGQGWPSTPVPQEYIDAVRRSATSATPTSGTATLSSRAPARIIDTRPTGRTLDGVGQAAGAVATGQVFEVPVAGRAGVPGDAKAAALTFTVDAPAGAGFLTVWPCGGARPQASVANFVAGQDVAATVMIGLGAGGRVCVSSSVAAQLIVDVAGHQPSSSSYVGLTPARLLDTRSPRATIDGQSSGAGLVVAGSTTPLGVVGRGGLPQDAASAYLTVTAVGDQYPGFVTVFSCGQAVPNVSTVNVLPHRAAANSTVIRVTGAAGVCLYASTRMHLLIDVSGYEAGASKVVAEVNQRAWDSRNTHVPLSVAQLKIPVALAGVPNPSHVALNATVINPSQAGFVTVYPATGSSCDQPPPNASVVNFVAGQTVADLVFSRVAHDSSTGAAFVCAYSSAPADFVLDIVSYAP